MAWDRRSALRWASLSLSFVALCACKSVRTVYDEFGLEVDTSQSTGGEKDFTTHMEKKFSAAFSEQKNSQGVPQAVSNRVSSYQKELRDSKRLDKEFGTKRYDGASKDMYTMSFAGAGKKYGVKEAYTGGRGSAVAKDLHPDFASSSRGIYSPADTYAGATSRSGLEGVRSPGAGRSYSTHESHYTRDTESGYFETRRNYTPPPKVMSKGEYYQKSIQDTRSLLGRDN